MRDTDNDWKVQALIIWMAFVNPLIMAITGAQLIDRMDRVSEKVDAAVRPTIMQEQVCVRSKNQFGWWSGTQEIGCK